MPLCVAFLVESLTAVLALVWNQLEVRAYVLLHVPEASGYHFVAEEANQGLVAPISLLIYLLHSLIELFQGGMRVLTKLIRSQGLGSIR